MSSYLNNRRRALGAAAAGLAASMTATSTLAQGPGSHQGGGSHHGWGGRQGLGGFGESMMRDPAIQERLLERRTSHMLDAVEATPEQRSKIMAIAKTGFKDLAPIRAELKASRDKGRALMFAANLDRVALEQLRQQQMKLRDAQSQRMLSGLLDALSVLTPEQRVKVANRRPPMGARGGAGWR